MGTRPTALFSQGSSSSDEAAAMRDVEKDFETISQDAQSHLRRVAAKQFADIERANAEALRTHDEEGKPLPAPNDEPSNLNCHQWVQVRTPLFKCWFEDWLTYWKSLPHNMAQTQAQALAALEASGFGGGTSMKNRKLAKLSESDTIPSSAMSRFFLPSREWNNSQPVLSESESHHALNVLRLVPGDKLTVFNGEGREGMARIAGVEGGRAALTLGSRTDSPRLPVQITLAQAVPKRKTIEMIIQKAVELGVARIAPLLSERSVVRLEAGEASRKREKWQEVALEACKQCGQNFLPEVGEPMPVASFLAGLPQSAPRLVGSLQPDARPLKSVLTKIGDIRAITVFVGPEGDFTPAELGLIKSHGAQPVSLGPIVLRTETAALYMLSVLAYEFFNRCD